MCVQTTEHLSASKPLLRASWRQARAALSLWMEGGEDGPQQQSTRQNHAGSGLRAVKGGRGYGPQEPGSLAERTGEGMSIDDLRAQSRGC